MKIKGKIAIDKYRLWLPHPGILVYKLLVITLNSKINAI